MCDDRLTPAVISPEAPYHWAPTTPRHPARCGGLQGSKGAILNIVGSVYVVLFDEYIRKSSLIYYFKGFRDSLRSMRFNVDAGSLNAVQLVILIHLPGKELGKQGQ